MAKKPVPPKVAHLSQFVKRERKVRAGQDVDEASAEVLAPDPIAPPTDVEERKAIAVNMRKEGHGYREIGERLGVNVKTAYGYVQSALMELKEQTEMDVETIRDLELERLDALLNKAWGGVKTGDVSSIMTALKILERRAKMLGLDAPDKQELTSFTAITPAEAAKMGEQDILAKVTALMDLAAGRKGGGDGTKTE